MEYQGEDYSSTFMGSFRRNDQETIQIMAKAAKIVPKACDILGISLSDSESEAEEDNDDTADGRGERSLSRSHHEDSEVMDGQVANDDSSEDNRQVQDARPHAGAKLRPRLLNSELESPPEEARVRKSRKRCASTPSTLNLNVGQSTSTNSEELRGLNPPINKKRRFPSISISSGPRLDSGSGAGDYAGLGTNPSWGNLTPEGYAIRKKMMRDMELLQKQLTQLAELEKEQYSLMKRYMRMQHYQQEEGQESAGTNSDGTNALSTATITNAVAAAYGARASNAGTGDDLQAMNFNDEEIFTDADLNVGAEEVVGEAAIDQEEVGSLI